MRASFSSEEIANARISCSDRSLKFLATDLPAYVPRIGILFLRHRRTGRSCRSRSDADRCSGGQRIGGVDDYFVGFSHAAQDFRLDAKVSPDLDVSELHNALVVHDANLLIFSAKYQRIVG